MTLSPTIFIVGTGSGTGKTTVANCLHEQFERADSPVICLYEIEVMSKREFRPFMREYLDASPNMAQALQTSVQAYTNKRVPDGHAFVSESLFPFLRWLILGNAEHESIIGYCEWLNQHLAARDPILVVLSCEKEAAVDRARLDRGENWYSKRKKGLENYPIHALHPDWDMWDVHQEEKKYFEYLGWETVAFDTSSTPTSEVVKQILATRQIEFSSEIFAACEVLEEGRYLAEDSADDRLHEVEIQQGRIRMLGVWLDLIPSLNGTLRIAHSNSTLEAKSDGVRLVSQRFGVVNFRRGQ